MSPPPTLHRDQIPDDVGLDLELDFDPSWLGEVLSAAQLAPVPERAGGARVRLDRDGANVLLTGSFETAARGECVACLEPVDTALSGTFTLHLEPEAPRTAKPGEEVELTEGELDVDTYDGERVVLADWLREQVLLEAPVHPRHEGACPHPLQVPVTKTPETAGAIDPRLRPLLKLAKKE